MLKITKGLRQFVNDDSEGIHAYTDSKGEGYVRVKEKGEDFCIAAHDYTKGGKYKFSWNEAMEALEDEELTMFSKKHAWIYGTHINDINNKLKEIGGDKFEDEWYWTSVERDSNRAWCFDSNNGQTYCDGKSSTHPVRPVLNL